jgi:hypothetical protein
MEAGTYFGTGSKYLEPSTLQYKWFGAVWRYTNSTRIIMGYWFGEDEAELLDQSKKAGWDKCSRMQNPSELRKVYDTYRSAQSEQDWNKRTMLSLFLCFREPWKHLKNGWYILRSNSGVPVHLSAVQKKRIFVWLEHTAVCESVEQIQLFIDNVNSQHQISLTTVSSLS